MSRHSVEVRCSERRTQPRFACTSMRATLRAKGRWGKTEVTVIDFNRHGMSILVDRPIEAPKGLCLCLELDDLKLANVHAVIHNCRSTESHGMKSFRCFTTPSAVYPPVIFPRIPIFHPFAFRAFLTDGSWISSRVGRLTTATARSPLSFATARNWSSTGTASGAWNSSRTRAQRQQGLRRYLPGSQRHHRRRC